MITSSKNIRRLALMVLLAGVSACQSNQQFIAANQDAAMKAATTRAAFELNCKAVTPTILSSKVVQLRFGYARTEYTVGVRGCGKQVVYIAVCLDSDTCNALSDTARLGEY